LPKENPSNEDNLTYRAVRAVATITSWWDATDHDDAIGQLPRPAYGACRKQSIVKCDARHVAR
jgi:hypothetical protein